MRRRLSWTVVAVTSMVLLAMLVPMAALMRDYAVEDRLSRAALEVQATESVVSTSDAGAVTGYLERINTGSSIRTTVLYPPEPDGGDGDIGPDPGEDARVVNARLTGQARVDDVEEGVQLLIPVSLNRNTAAAEETPVIRVVVSDSVLDRDLVGGWLVLLLLGLLLLGAAVLLADRLGRSFVVPIRRLADQAGALGDRRRGEARASEVGPPEVRELAHALNRLVDRVEQLLARERAQIADLSHRLRTPVTALRLRVDAVADPEERARLAGDLDALQATVDAVVREARRSEREGLVAETDGAAVLLERVEFWRPLFDDLERELTVVDGRAGTDAEGVPVPVRSSAEDLVALLDVLVDNVLSHAPDDAPARVELAPVVGGGLRLVVEDGGPGFPDGVDVLDRGSSGGGSTGLGLSIVQQTATESGGGLEVGRSSLGGARVQTHLGGA